MRACGRGPSYSAGLIARAIELYRNGVKRGVLGWRDVQAILQREFPDEFPPHPYGLPAPETVLGWVKKRGDLPERLSGLGIRYSPMKEYKAAREPVLASGSSGRAAVLPPPTAAVIEAASALLAHTTALGILFSLTRR